MDEIIEQTVRDIVDASKKFGVDYLPVGLSKPQYWANELVRRLPGVFLHWLGWGPPPTRETLLDIAAISLLWIVYLVEYLN